MNWQAIGTLALMTNIGGCGNEAPFQQTQDDELGGTQTTSMSYPYIGEHGELVCTETEIRAGDERIVEKEFYHLDVMNDGLSGRGVLDPDGVLFMKNAGLARVETCDDARRYIALLREYEQSQLPPETISPRLEDRTVPTNAAEDVSVDKVADGRHSTTPYMVRLAPNGVGNCSGFLIGPRVLLTAAHCFPSSGMFNVRVDQGRGQNGGANAFIGCLSGGSSCSLNPTGLNVNVHRFPNYGGTGDYGRDMAVVVSRFAWAHSGPVEPGEHPFDFLPLTARVPTGEVYWVDGYGAHASTGSGFGIHRLANSAQGIDVIRNGYWEDEVQKDIGRPCKGDSGSAAINTTRTRGHADGPDMAIGIAAGAQGVSPTDFCPDPGNLFWYSRIDDKLGFLQSILDVERLPRCRSLSHNGWPFQACY